MTTNIPYVIILVAGTAVAFEVVRLCWYAVVSRHEVKKAFKFSAERPESDIRVLVIGDSTTYGAGVVDPKNSLVGRIANDFPHIHIENWSKSARSISQLSKLLKNIVVQENKPKKYHALLIMVGGIDVIHATPFSLIEKNLRESIQHSKKIADKTIYIIPNNPALTPLQHPPLTWLLRYRSRKMEQLCLRIIEDEQIEHINLFREKEDWLQSSPLLYSPDKTHPNDAGYAFWYAEIQPLLSRILNQ